MAELTKSDVKHVASLADFRFSEKEILRLKKELSETLEFVKTLNEVRTEKVVPTSHVTGLQNVTKEDYPHPSLTQEQVLMNAPSCHNNFFKTKSIF